MVVEALTFKLTLDFFTYFNKNKVHTSNVRISFYDIINRKREYVNFNNIEELREFYNNNYFPYDPCYLGDIVSIEAFDVYSELYNFKTSYNAIDVVGDVKVTPGFDYDVDRNEQRSIYLDRQTSFISNSISDYRRYYDEIYGIYVTGIYSPCYAEPGWSQGTWYLGQLRNAFKSAITNATNETNFPYKKSRIVKLPPK